MTRSLHTTIRRLAVVLASAAVAGTLSGVALGSTGSGLNVPSGAMSGLKASSANWAAKGRLVDANGRPKTNPFAVTPALLAASRNWAAKAKLLDAYGHPKRNPFAVTPALRAASANWAAKAKILNAYGRPFRPLPASSAKASSGFGWDEFGIGAAAMLGFVLVAVGLTTTAHYRRNGFRPRALS